METVEPDSEVSEGEINHKATKRVKNMDPNDRSIYIQRLRDVTQARINTLLARTQRESETSVRRKLSTTAAHYPPLNQDALMPPPYQPIPATANPAGPIDMEDEPGSDQDEVTFDQECKAPAAGEQPEEAPRATVAMALSPASVEISSASGEDVDTPGSGAPMPSPALPAGQIGSVSDADDTATLENDEPSLRYTTTDFELDEFCAWFSVNMSGARDDGVYDRAAVAKCKLICRKSNPSMFLQDRFAEGKPLPETVERLTNSVLRYHRYTNLALLFGGCLGSLSDSLVWINRVGKKTMLSNEDHPSHIAFRALIEDYVRGIRGVAMIRSFWRFFDQVNEATGVRPPQKITKQQRSLSWAPWIPTPRTLTQAEQREQEKEKKSRLMEIAKEIGGSSIWPERDERVCTVYAKEQQECNRGLERV